MAIQAAAAGPNPPSSWRIASTAVVLEQEAELRVVKKLKLVGTPIKVRGFSNCIVVGFLVFPIAGFWGSGHSCCDVGAV